MADFVSGTSKLKGGTYFKDSTPLVVVAEAIDTSDHLLLIFDPDLGMNVQSFRKLRINKAGDFPNPGFDSLTSPVDLSNMVGHKYELEVSMKTREMHTFQGMYSRYGTQRPMLWKPGGKESEVNTYHYITTLTLSQQAFSLGDVQVEGSSLSIQLRRWDGATEVTTELGTDVTTLTHPYNGIVELTVVPASQRVYATYERYLNVVFDDNEIQFTPIGKGYYQTRFSLREVNS